MFVASIWAGVTRAPWTQQAGARASALALLLLLAGCGDNSSINPVSWWHNLEGGAIAQDRPPPPNSDAPYPNLTTVPDRPPPPDSGEHARIQEGLIADRANALYEDQTQPIPRLPGTPEAPPAAPSADQAANASLAAANAPPPPPVIAPSKAPVASVTAAALPPPPPDAGSLQSAGPTPDLPAGPPPAPEIAGLPIAPTVPAPPPPTPVSGAVPQPPSAPVAIAFPTNSAELPQTASVQIRTLAQSRGARSVLVTGFGDAASTDPASQAAALPLGLSRARAVAAALRADGVPDSAIRISAQPLGTGAAARLVD